MDTREILSLRAWILNEIRAFFHARGFLEVDTPILVDNPGMDFHLDAFAVLDHRGRAAGWLNTSPEYHMKRLLAAGSGPIFQIARAFRAGELGSKHESEFLMLEWYRPDAGWHEVMRDTEELIAQLVTQKFGAARLMRNAQSIDVTTPWQRVSVESLFQQHMQRSCFALSDDEFFEAFALHIDPLLGKPRPVFVVDWPARYASLARIQPGTREHPVAERFEAYIDGLELCNGFGELTDANEQRKRFEQENAARLPAGKPTYPLDENLLKVLPKMPPSGGNALGIERLLMLLADVQTIQEVRALR